MSGDEDRHSRISLVEQRIEEVARAQGLMHRDLKQSLEKFVLVMKMLAGALIVELVIQAVLMSILILKDTNKDFKANRQGFELTNPRP